jgi:hypothetical protein
MTISVLAGSEADRGNAAATVPVLDRFARATADLLERRELLRRTDNKLLLSADRVPALIERLIGSYALQHGGVTSFSPYSTLYFDTEDLRTFHDHRRGKRLRYKIRVRHYHDRKVTYLEVKRRRSELVSFKHRMPLDYGVDALGPEQIAFITKYTGIDGHRLRPTIWIDYQRATLIGLEHPERFTIDLDVRCAPAEDRDAVRTAITATAFLEVKQAPIKLSTPVMRALRELGLRATSVSKYCTAITLAGLATTRARFRAVLRAAETSP